jgi:hypothetical protein
MKIKERVMSIEELYQKEVKDAQEQLYKAYERIAELIEDREKMIVEVQKICKTISARRDLKKDESLVKLPPLKESSW